MTRLQDRPWGDLLTAVAECSPAPGGGSSAACAAALAASLVQMAAGFAGRHDVRARSETLRGLLLDQAEKELTSYKPVLAALRRSPTEFDRVAAYRQALSDAANTPLDIVRAASELACLAGEMVRVSKPSIAGDAEVGWALAEAATRSAARLVEINLAELGDDPRLDEAAEMMGRARSAHPRSHMPDG